MARSESIELISFDLTSAKDHLEKLRREIDRFESTREREQMGDHLVNAFWTAWHLHDWVWDTIRDQPELQRRVFAKFGISASDVNGQRDFGGELGRRNRDLEVARIIATSSKHVHVSLHNDSPKAVGTAFRTVTAMTNALSGGMQVLDGMGGTHIEWSPMIVVEDKPTPALEVLQRLDAFWVDLIYGCEIERKE